MSVISGRWTTARERPLAAAMTAADAVWTISSTLNMNVIARDADNEKVIFSKSVDMCDDTGESWPAALNHLQRNHSLVAGQDVLQ